LLNFGFELLAKTPAILKEPSFITGVIAKILGVIINFFFNIAYSINHEHSLGISIILLTIFARCLMIPIAYKQNKSMSVMHKMQPEIKKIQDKYKGKTSDPEIQKKMNMETQKLYAKYDYSPLSGCLPLLIQMPIFFGIYYVMKHPFLYIDKLGELYTSFANIVIEDATTGNNSLLGIVKNIALGAGITSGTSLGEHEFCMLLNALDPAKVKEMVVACGNSNLQAIFDEKEVIESFMGISLTETVGFALNIKLIIPILSGATTWLSSWMMTRRNKSADAQMQSQQKVMNIVMPLMMMWITTSIPAGVGLYWVVSNVFQIVQQFILGKHFDNKIKREETEVGGKKND
jgi:YidC/Oxa1 family membrane protein insertase